jgi:hypothetical protein
MSDDADGCRSTEDNNLPLSITHARDIIAFGGQVEQDYRFLIYQFQGPQGTIDARMYLDEPWTVSIINPLAGEPVPADVLVYLQQRFDHIRQLGGPDGYTHIWSKPKRVATERPPAK